ncbi:hypothetical protein GE061_009272 [Apolygus lucorum]|uniref:Uncharacterized protein n=1 Tax=Apolygus lucorum TaxID=248454 RepID=A0A6A4JKK6_APOLU|nr:hypothetical protein GE061_009272 [Apolygus lucorum]
MRSLWFLVVLGFVEAQFYPPVDFSNGCTVPSDNFGQQQPIVLSPMVCHIVMRESARALGLLQPFLPVQNSDLAFAHTQQQLAQRALNAGVMSNMCNPPVTVARALECRRAETPAPQPALQASRAVDCSQPVHQASRGLECGPAPTPTPASRALDCAGSLGCFPHVAPAPAARLLDCNLVPIPAARFVGCAPNVLQEAERAMPPPTPPPCPEVCSSLCPGCQRSVQAQRFAGVEESQVDFNQASRLLPGSQYSYNIIPVKLKPKTPGADEQPMNHLLLLQLRPDTKKEEPAEGAQKNLVQVTSRSL